MQRLQFVNSDLLILSNPSICLEKKLRQEDSQLFGIKKDEKGNENLTTVLVKTFTCWNQFLALFGLGPLGKINCDLAFVHKYIDSKKEEFSPLISKHPNNVLITQRINEIQKRAFFKLGGPSYTAEPPFSEKSPGNHSLHSPPQNTKIKLTSYAEKCSKLSVLFSPKEFEELILNAQPALECLYEEMKFYRSLKNRTERRELPICTYKIIKNLSLDIRGKIVSALSTLLDSHATHVNLNPSSDDHCLVARDFLRPLADASYELDAIESGVSLISKTNGEKDDIEFDKLFKFLSPFSAEERHAFIRLISPLLDSCDPEELISTLEELSKFPINERTHIVKLMLKINYLFSCKDYQTIKAYKHEEREEAVKIAWPIIKKIAPSARMSICSALCMISLSEQKDLMARLMPILRNKTSFKGVAKILKALCEVPEKNRADVIAKLHISDLLDLDFSGRDPDLSEMASDITAAIYFLSDCPKEERETVARLLNIFKDVRIATTRIDRVLPKCRYPIFEVRSLIAFLSPEDREPLLNQLLAVSKCVDATTLWKFFTIVTFLSRKLCVFKTNTLFAQRDWENIIESIEETDKCDQKYFFDVIEQLPLELLTQYFEYFIEFSYFAMIKNIQHSLKLQAAFLTGEISAGGKEKLRDLLVKTASFPFMQEAFTMWAGSVACKLTPFYNDASTSDITLSIGNKPFYLHRVRLSCEQDGFFASFLAEDNKKQLPQELEAETIIRIKALYGIPFTSEEWEHPLALDIGLRKTPYTEQAIADHADCTLLIEGQKIPASNFVLSINSLFFKTSFSGSYQEANCNEIEIKDIPLETVRAVLDYFYTGEWPEFDLEDETDKSEENFKEILVYFLV